MPRPWLCASMLAVLFCARLAAQTSAPADPMPAELAAAKGTPAVYPAGESTALGAQIAALLQDPKAAHAHWGIAVAKLDGSPIYGLDEAKLFHPASTAKLFTTAAAMAILGPQYTVNTTVFGDLDAATGTVKGDLTLYGGGDSAFNTRDLPYRATGKASDAPSDLETLTTLLLAKGVHRVSGDIVGSDERFGHEAPPEGWEAADLMWGYGALPSALSVGDNELKMTLAPGPANFPAVAGENVSSTLSIDQSVPYLQIENQVSTSDPATIPRISLTLPPVAQPGRRWMLIGSIASGTPPLAEHVALPEPALFAAEVLRKMLLDQGVVVTGTTRVQHALTSTSEPYLKAWSSRPGCGWTDPGEQGCAFSCLSAPHSMQVLATHASAPLAQDVVFTLKTSANLHAENLLGQLALKNACPGQAAVNGAGLVRNWLLAAGLQEGDFVFYDGSGLSVKDLVTPRAEVELLAFAAQQPWFPQWKAALPVGGVDGTLASRFTEAPLKGKVLAKTGTLGESRTLAGYVEAASGATLLFSILEDNRFPGSNADQAVMDRIVAAIAAGN